VTFLEIGGSKSGAKISPEPEVTFSLFTDCAEVGVLVHPGSERLGKLQVLGRGRDCEKMTTHFAFFTQNENGWHIKPAFVGLSYYVTLGSTMAPYPFLIL
jgi:hypothetical protein